MKRIVLRHNCIVKHGGGERQRISNEVFSNNHDCDTSRANVFLGSSIDETELEQGKDRVRSLVVQYQIRVEDSMYWKVNYF
jgi:hypothetical protein